MPKELAFKTYCAPFPPPFPALCFFFDFRDQKSSGLGYELRGFQTFFNNLVELSRSALIWPPIDELIYSGDTVEQLYDIQSAAREQATPFYNFLVHASYPNSPLQLPSGFLINRTFPIRPEELGTVETPRLEKDLELVSQIWCRAEGLVALRWYSLPKTIHERQVEFGNICAYFVNGRFRYAVHCMEGREPAEVKSFVPLKDVRQVQSSLPLNLFHFIFD